MPVMRYLHYSLKMSGASNVLSGYVHQIVGDGLQIFAQLSIVVHAQDTQLQTIKSAHGRLLIVAEPLSIRFRP